MPEKIYTEAEVAALLERAARMQASAAPTDGAGLTLEEVKSAAAAAGIAPQFVELAATASSDRGQAYWSIPTGVGRGRKDLRLGRTELRRVLEHGASWAIGNGWPASCAMRNGASRRSTG